MLAATTHVARKHSLSTVDVPHVLAVQSIIGAWTVWVVGQVAGQTAAYWGGILLTFALWACVAAVDRLYRFDVVSADSAALLRALALGIAMVCMPRALAAAPADLAAWGAVVVVAAATHLLAPWALRNAGAFEFWRWLDDVKAAAALAGVVMGAVTFFGTASFVVGYRFEPETFVSALTACVFCLLPTALTYRVSSREAVRSF